MVDKEKVRVFYWFNDSVTFYQSNVEIPRGIEVLAEGPFLPDPRTLDGKEAQKFGNRDIIVKKIDLKGLSFTVIDRPFASESGVIDSYEVVSKENIRARAKGDSYTGIESYIQSRQK